MVVELGLGGFELPRVYFSELLHPLDAVGPYLLPLLLDPVLLLAPHQFLHVPLVLLLLQIDLVVELLLERIPLLLQHLPVQLHLLLPDLLPYQLSHLLYVLVLYHRLRVYLSALLQDPFQLGPVPLPHPVLAVTRPVLEVLRLALARLQVLTL